MGDMIIYLYKTTKEPLFDLIVTFRLVLCKYKERHYKPTANPALNKTEDIFPDFPAVIVGFPCCSRRA